MIKLFCDNCNQELFSPHITISGESIDVNWFGEVLLNNWERMDYCGTKCMLEHLGHEQVDHKKEEYCRVINEPNE